MKTSVLSGLAATAIGLSYVYSQAVSLNSSNLQAVGVAVTVERFMEKDSVKVTKNADVKEFDEPTFAKVKSAAFKNGTINVKVSSKLLKDAPDFARGFIGVAFRINDDNSKFECIYLRPTNARADDQVRRNRSIQYFAFPDFKFERLRKEAPGKYETYADMAMKEWIDIKIEVMGTKAKLFLNGNQQPALIVDDLKLGADAVGAVGLWVDVGTEGHFADLTVSNE
jgi:hypothetical protein